MTTKSKSEDSSASGEAQPESQAAKAEALSLHERATVDAIPAGNSQPAVSLGQDELTSSAQIGRYRVLELLGRGGMGRVYLAEQDQPRRQVALKLMAPGSGAEALHRFEREAELLGRLEHANIARIYEAGLANEHGAAPYLAMEYVAGLELLEHAERAQLNLPQRVALIIKIAEAVHFAHLRGVIHRDLKPANILVNAKSEPKLLDFGIAQVIERQHEGSKTNLTREGQVIGTLQYMSPEQLAGDSKKIDVRTDVYALGVISYELFSGKLPYAMEQASFLEAVRILDRAEPHPLQLLNAGTRGDLNTIVMKALAKEPSQRYSSVAEFADDLARYLANEPIRARPATLSYLAGRFVRRHRALVGATALALLSLAGAAWQSNRSAQKARDALAVSTAKAAELQAVNEFVQNMLLSADPERDDAQKLTMVEFLDGAKNSLANLQNQPAAQAQVTFLIAQVNSRLGRYEDASALFAKALAASQRSMEGNKQAYEIAQSAELSAEIMIAQGVLFTVSGQPEQARDFLNDKCAALKQQYGSAHRLSYRCQNALGFAYQELGESERVVAIDEAILKDAASTLPQDPETLNDVRYNLAHAYIQLGKGELGEQMLRAVLAEELKHASPNSERVLASKKALGQALQRQNRLPEALVLYQEVADGRLKLYGAGSDKEIDARFQLASGLVSNKEFARAEPILADLIKVIKDQRSDTYLAALNVQANLFRQTDRLAEAERTYLSIIATEINGPENNSTGSRQYKPPTVMARGGLAGVLVQLKRLQEADVWYREAIALAPKVLGESHVFNGQVASNAAECALQMGDKARARQLLEPALKLLNTTLGAQHPRTIEAQERWQRAQ